MVRLILLLLTGLLATASPTGAQKLQTWVEVRSPHFNVITNAGEKHGRRVADQFEQIRSVFQKAFPQARVDPGQPVVILAVKDEKSLKELLPAYWERKDGKRPSGVFFPAMEKHYVAMRLDSSDSNPYRVIYHEYVHLLANLNYRYLPLWLQEGFADFYGNSELGAKEVGLGRPSEVHLMRLQRERLLPLEVLFTADHSSEHYTQRDKASIFYAQAWAITHFFILGDPKRQPKPLDVFASLIDQGVEQLEAARRAFGDLKALQKQIEDYCRQPTFYYAKIKTPERPDDKEFAARLLPPAEAAATRGEFLAMTNRPVEARALLEEALRLDPSLAVAHESMGVLLFREGNRPEASRWFRRALELDSQSFLTHYFGAVLAMESGVDEDTPAYVIRNLERAVDLQPDFAPAHASLADFYAGHGRDFEKAQAAARKAIELEPANLQFQYTLARVLWLAEKTSEARQVAQQILIASQSTDERMRAQQFLDSLQRQEEYLETRRRTEEEWMEHRRRADEAERLREEARRQETEAPPVAAASLPPRQLSTRPVLAEGQVVAVACSDPAVLDLTLDFGGLTLKLRSTNYHKVEFQALGWQPPDNFNPCQDLRGHNAEVKYALVADQPYAGEILTITIKR